MGGEETNGWFGVAPFDISFSFGAVCKAAVGSVNQVVNIMDVAVENLHIGTLAMDLRAPAEADSASNLSLNNSGVSTMSIQTHSVSRQLPSRPAWFRFLQLFGTILALSNRSTSSSVRYHNYALVRHLWTSLLASSIHCSSSRRH